MQDTEIKKIIERIINQGIKKLKLEPIKIIYTDNTQCCFCNDELNGIHIEIDITYLMVLLQLKNKHSILFKRIKTNNIKNRLKFILFHEVSHYFQYIKFNKWFMNNYSKDIYLYVSCRNENEYRNIKLEKNADKLASILLTI